MAKADKQEWQALVDWFNDREARNESVPQWRRVVFGYDVLVENCCDPASDTLAWKPRIVVPAAEWSPYDHPFWCQTCGNTFRTFEILIEHRWRKHTAVSGVKTGYEFNHENHT